MTTRQLNNKIKKLGIKFYSQSQKPAEEFFNWLEAEGKSEFIDLYNADREMKYISKESVLILMRLNLSHHIIAAHQFGIHVELKNLI